jgi:vacuolar-type H+-ATPase subunit I/STV1
MREWLVWPDFSALAPGLVFAAGALTVTLVQCVIVACTRRLARRRGRAQVFPPDDPRRVWAELTELRADCATSTANLETVVARLKDKATAHLVERNSSAERLQRLQEALDQRAALIDALERQVAELELLRTRHALELQRRDEELGRRSDALASAENTIALLQGMLDVAGRARSPSRVAG